MTGKSIATRQGKGKSRTDLARLQALKDAEIDYSDIPELPEGFWDKAQVVIPPHKVQVSVRFDDDLVTWFKSQGPGYQTRMNAVLRSFMDSMRRNLARPSRFSP